MTDYEYEVLEHGHVESQLWSNGILKGDIGIPIDQVAEVQQRLQLLAMEAGRRGTGHW